MAKNECRYTQNLAKAAGAGAGTGTQKKDAYRTLAMMRTSTMGKFDRVLDGENKLCGVRRKVCSRLSPLFPSPRVLITFSPVQPD